MDAKKTAFAVVGVALYIGMFFLLYKVFIDKAAILDFAEDRAVLGPTLIIVLHLVQSVVFFLPGSTVSIAAGYLFGMWKGFLLNLIGTTVGTAILFVVARRASRFFGYSRIVTMEIGFLKEIFRKTHSRKLAYMIGRGLPMVPGDTVTVFVASFTKNGFQEYTIFSTLGAMPKLLLDTFTGYVIFKYGFFGFPTLVTVAAICVILVAGFIWQAREQKREKMRLARAAARWKRKK